MRLQDIFYKTQLTNSEDNSIKSEINEFVLNTLENFNKKDADNIVYAENFIGQALDSYEDEGMKEDFMPFFLDHIKELPGAITQLIEAWKERNYVKAKEIINNHGYMLRFHSKWDEVTGYDFYCVCAIINNLISEDETAAHKEIIDDWEQLKTTIRSNDYDGIVLNKDIYKRVLQDLIFAYGEINDELKQAEIQSISSHFKTTKDNMKDYPNIHAYIRVSSYVIEYIKLMQKLYKKEFGGS